MTSSSPRVFLCHSSLDKPIARRLANDLEDHNMCVWFDEWELSVGDSLTQKIFAAIDECDYLIAVISPNSISSNWVARELSGALYSEITGGKIIVLPVLIEHCTLPPQLKDKVYADLTGNNYTAGLRRILSKLSGQDEPALGKSELMFLIDIGDKGSIISGMTDIRPETRYFIPALRDAGLIQMYGGSNIQISLTEKGFVQYYAAIDYSFRLPDALRYRLEELKRRPSTLLVLQRLYLQARQDPAKPESADVGDHEDAAALQRGGLISATFWSTMGPTRRYYLNRFGMLVAHSIFGPAI